MSVSEGVSAGPVLAVAHRFRFEAARRLTGLAPDHPCSRIHGHGFEVEIELVGPIDPRSGIVVDYNDIAAAWEPVGRALDHQLLNDVDGLDNPTSELIAVWIWGRLAPVLRGLTTVSVMETPATRATYRGPAAQKGR